MITSCLSLSPWQLHLLLTLPLPPPRPLDHSGCDSLSFLAHLDFSPEESPHDNYAPYSHTYSQRCFRKLGSIRHVSVWYSELWMHEWSLRPWLDCYQLVSSKRKNRWREMSSINGTDIKGSHQLWTPSAVLFVILRAALSALASFLSALNASFSIFFWPLDKLLLPIVTT